MPALNTIEYAGSLTVNVGSTQASKLAIQVLLLGSLGSQLQNAVPWAINSFPLVCFEKCGPPDGVRHPTARRKRPEFRLGQAIYGFDVPPETWTIDLQR
jgi:hypothetical protein